VRSELRELNISGNTLVLFCSDNGPEGNEKAPGSSGGLRGRKRSLFEGGVRVPGLAEWPAKIKAGRETSIPAVTSDYLPTILAAIGAEAADERPIDGVNLIQLFAGEMQSRHAPIAFESAGQLALVDNRYKIVHQEQASKREKPSATRPQLDPQSFMLFDLQADRTEAKDLAQDHPDVVTGMVATLDAWRQSCRDSLAENDY
jgi:arylsulfatase A-like enzyme